MEDYKGLQEEWGAARKRFIEMMPEHMKGFGQFYQASMKEGKVSFKTKELIAVALGVATHCEWCIAVHVKNALDAGATREEILESAWIAVVMGGGPALMYMQGVEKALDDFAKDL